MIENIYRYIEKPRMTEDDIEIIETVESSQNEFQTIDIHTEQIEKQKEQSYRTIHDIYTKYMNHPYMLEKITHYVSNQLPVIMDNMQKQYETRITRFTELTNDQDNFIQSFMNNNPCFYVHQTEKFIYYNAVHYQLINEDDIIHNILSSISKDRQIMSWKQKTKINLMKRIKENSLLSSIPESATIQFVLESLSPAIFPTKKEAKYFLTILGDNILRKNTNLIHYIDPSAKRFLRELNSSCQLILGASLSNTFRYKFYEYSYKDCRLVKINKAVKNESVWASIYATIDILCVACHYSNRYISSDDFLVKSCNDDALIKNVFYLKDIQPHDIVNVFLTEFMIIDSSHNDTHQITWKNMQYIWKQFLEIKNLPSVMFLNTFKNLLIEAMPEHYDAENDIFCGVYCDYLQSIQNFLSFWEESIVYDENEFDFEVEELSYVFTKWCREYALGISNINDNQIIDIVSYFFPNIEIEKNKYIQGIRCVLWDKQMDIQIVLDKMRETYKQNYHDKLISHINQNISIYDAYIFYRMYYSSSTEQKLLVSKSYFEKYIFDNLTHYLIDFKFISSEWYLSEQ